MPQYFYSLSERGDKSLMDSKRNRVPNGADRSFDFIKNLDLDQIFRQNLSFTYESFKL